MHSFNIIEKELIERTYTNPNKMHLYTYQRQCRVYLDEYPEIIEGWIENFEIKPGANWTQNITPPTENLNDEGKYIPELAKLFNEKSVFEDEFDTYHYNRWLRRN